MLHQIASAVTVDVPVYREEEELRVFEWRREQFWRLGLTFAGMADALAARAHVDWHDLASLIERGCDPTLACDILF